MVMAYGSCHFTPERTCIASLSMHIRTRLDHNEVQDTFYVISGKIRVTTRDLGEEVCLSVGQTYAGCPGRSHRVTMLATVPLCFLFCRRLATTTLSETL